MEKYKVFIDGIHGSIPHGDGNGHLEYSAKTAEDAAIRAAKWSVMEYLQQIAERPIYATVYNASMEIVGRFRVTSEIRYYTEKAEE